MERITIEESISYMKIEPNDPETCSKATAFMLTPSKEPEFEGWDDVTYFTKID